MINSRNVLHGDDKRVWVSDWEKWKQKKKKESTGRSEGKTEGGETGAGNENKTKWNGRSILKLIPLAFFLIVALGGTLMPYVLKTLGTALVVNDRIDKSVDSICICGGGKAERVGYGSKLFKELNAKVMIVLGDSISLPGLSATWSELGKREAVRRFGVPENRIISDSKASSTYEEALMTKNLMERNDLKSVVVVSEPYHTRRVKLIFSTVFRGSGIDMKVSAVEPSWFDAEQWWSNDKMVVMVFEEYAKILLFIIRHLTP